MPISTLIRGLHAYQLHLPEDTLTMSQKWKISEESLAISILNFAPMTSYFNCFHLQVCMVISLKEYYEMSLEARPLSESYHIADSFKEMHFYSSNLPCFRTIHVHHFFIFFYFFYCKLYLIILHKFCSWKESFCYRFNVK